MTLYLNTTQAPSMIPDGMTQFNTITPQQAAELLLEGFFNVSNPTHANTLIAVSQLLSSPDQDLFADIRNAQGGHVTLAQGDQLIAVQVGNLPRETREFSDEEISNATFTFRLITALE
jgi:hypothetical protein